MSTYEKTVCLNQDPHYDRFLKDSLRMGSFVVIKHEGKEHIARLECRQIDIDDDNPDEYETTIRLRLFHPLFNRNKIECKKPKPPKHSFAPIFSGPGAQQAELYESSDRLWISTSNKNDNPKILFPAFVFTVDEFSLPKNAWAIGLHNVFVVRTWEMIDYEHRSCRKIKSLVPLPSIAALGFPNDHPDYKKSTRSVVPQRCLHESLWNGLYALKKGLNKCLNKRTGQSNDKEVVSLNVGHVPLETIQYISLISNYLATVPSHTITLSDSFLHLDQTLRRSKVKISFNAGVIRFKTP